MNVQKIKLLILSYNSSYYHSSLEPLWCSCTNDNLCFLHICLVLMYKNDVSVSMISTECKVTFIHAEAFCNPTSHHAFLGKMSPWNLKLPCWIMFTWYHAKSKVLPRNSRLHKVEFFTKLSKYQHFLTITISKVCHQLYMTQCESNTNIYARIKLNISNPKSLFSIFNTVFETLTSRNWNLTTLNKAVEYTSCVGYSYANIYVR